MTETKMQLVDWLDDLCVRFIVNLPKEELESVERICFQVEEAQWFYEDFVRPLDPLLPSMNLRQFCLKIFQHCPLLSGFTPYHHSAAFSEFLAYKTRVPVRGAIMLNQAMDEVVLVKGWKKNANWSFPRGKINKDEKDMDCAIREVYEETGYDLRTAGLAANEEATKYIEITMREQHMRLYVFRGVPMDTYFEPRTRKEISKIQWYKLSELPTLKKKHQQEARGDDAVNANKFYMVAPFLVPLKKWISQQKTQDAVNGPRHLRVGGVDPLTADEPASIHPPQPDQDNMGRLLLQLRQSGQPSRESHLPEVLGMAPANGSTAQLKNLLHVPDTTLPPRPAEPPVKSKEKAQAMLSLLRSSPQSRVEQYSEPQTPLEQIIIHPEMPAPPKIHHARQSHEAIAHLPQFPFFPAQSSSHDYGRTIQAFQAPTGPKGQSQRSGHLHAPSSSTNVEGLVQVPPASKGPPAPAPYQRTGDPQFAHAQQSARVQSSIPPANQLPPPKLNAHSSALLDLFKAETLASEDSRPEFAPLQTPKSELPASATPLTSTPSSKPLVFHGLPSFNMSIRPALASPLFEGPLQGASKPRLPQQRALLDLFKIPPAPPATTEKSTTITQADLAPVELAAHPSSAHRNTAHPSTAHSPRADPRIGSQALQYNAPVAPMSPAPQPLVNGKVTIQKRPDSFSGSKKPAVSATVTGPLHVPQFESILKRAPEHQENEALEQKSRNAMPPTRADPIKILPRPSAASAIPAEPSTEKHQAPKEASRNKPKASAQRKSTAERTTPSKPFHPQILKRAPEALATPPPAPPVIQQLEAHRLSPVLPQETPMLDRRASQTKEQKMALLSLFSKPKVLDQLQVSSKEPLVSPMSEVPSSHPRGTATARPGSTSSAVEDNNSQRSKLNNAISASRAPSPPLSHSTATTSVAAADPDRTPKARTASTFPLAADRSTPHRFGSVASAFGAPLLPPPSRQSSLVSMPSDDGQGGRRTPRTAAGDKQFLLGFLDGVTRGLR